MNILFSPKCGIVKWLQWRTTFGREGALFGNTLQCDVWRSRYILTFLISVSLAPGLTPKSSYKVVSATLDMCSPRPRLKLTYNIRTTYGNSKNQAEIWTVLEKSREEGGTASRARRFTIQ